MVEIRVKYGETFKKGRDFHRIDLSMRKTIFENDMELVFQEDFNKLKNKVIKLKENILKDARI